jgi:hypothetical protein
MITEGWQKFVTGMGKRSAEIYYHVAGEDTAQNIVDKGIEGSTQAGDRDYSYGDEGTGEKRVYLFSSQDAAYMAAFARPDSDILGGARPPFVFVKVDLSVMKPVPEVHDDIELPDFDAYYVIGDIPSQAVLDVESESQVSDRLGGEEEVADDYSLNEEEEKLRVFEVQLVVKIQRAAGIDDTLTDIRSIPGVTVVSSVESQRSGAGFVSTIKVKFHPSKEAMTAQTYVKQILIPAINSREIPGCIVMRYVPRSLETL